VFAVIRANRALRGAIVGDRPAPAIHTF